MKLSLLRIAFAAGLAAFIGVAHVAYADDINVACDSAALIAAVDTANGTPAADTLILTAACSYTFTTGDATNSDSALPRITTDITFDGNGATIVRSGAGTDFRLLYVEASGSLTLDDVAISGGQASDFGGGIFNAGTLTIRGSIIAGNAAGNNGGGISNSGTSTVTNSIVSGNSAAGGGGIYVPAGTVTLTGSTIAGNSAGSNGGGILNDGGTVTVTNGIVRGNSSQVLGAATVTYSIVEGGHAGTGNLDVDPQFVDPEIHTSAPTTDGDYHIQLTSPAIDAGDNAAATGTDIDGGTRIVGDIVDMGADEVDYCPIYASPYTVAASNTASLIKAIKCANVNPDPATINLTNSTYSFSAGDVVNNDSALPRITTDIDINGNGATLERDSGSVTDFRLLRVTASGDLTLDDVAISGGQTANGGGIRNDGTLTVTDSTFTGNASTSTTDGGAIFNAGALTVGDSTFSGNNATDEGGGIYNDALSSSLSVTGSTFSGNTALHRGGGISNRGTGTATISNSVFAGNVASESGTGNGGAIYTFGTLTVTNSLLAGNKAINGGGIGNGFGTLTVTGTTIAGNHATSEGGGIRVFLDSAVVTNSILWGNSSAIFGDATVTYSVVEGGFAGTGNIDLDPSFVAPEPFASAPTTAGDYHLQTNSPALDAGDTLEATGTDIDGAARVQYGIVDIGADEVDYCPAYVFPYTVAAEDTADLSRAVRCANANPDASAINLTNSIYSFGAGDLLNNDSALPRITTIITIDGSGATLERDAGAATNFRLIYIAGSGNLTLNNLTVTGGLSSSFGGGIHSDGGPLALNNSIVSNNSGTQGGGIYTDGGALTLTVTTLSGNSATRGGGIYNDTGTLTMIDSTLSGNDASLFGGGIDSAGTLTVTASTLSGNDAAYGGGIYYANGTLTLTDTTVSGNTATQQGGGIRNNSGNVTITDSTVSGNDSTVYGGGIFSAFGTLTMTGGTLSGNSAGQGGGMYANSSTMITLTGNTLTGNSADYGGALYNNGSAVTVSNSILSGNSVTGDGGGIYNTFGSMAVINSTISGNHAADDGGGIYVSNGTPTVTNSIVWGNSDQLSGSVTVTYSIVEGGFTGTGNLDADPLFVSAVDHSLAPTTVGDYHIQVGSPAIDAGDNAAVTEALDIDGDDRIIYGMVDMGADEEDTCLAYSSPHTVTAGDSADLVLAIKCANADPDASTINLTESTYTFTAGDTIHPDSALPRITTDITINGNGATIERDSGAVTDFRLLYVDTGATVTLDDLTISGGHASDNGGGILNDGTLAATDLTVTGSSAANNGGGIHHQSGTLTLTDSTITGNSAANNGAGIAVNSGTVTLVDSTVSGNDASNNSGGLFLFDGTLELLGTTVSGNTAGNAGGLYAGFTSAVTIVNSTLAGNDSGNSGGGIINDGTMDVINSIVSGNEGNNGGGLHNSFGTLTVTNSVISGNEAGLGGSILNSFGTLTITNSIAWGNSSPIHNVAGTVTVTYSIVEGGYSGTGNLDADPLFVSEADHTLAPTTAGDYHIQTSSPAIDRGSNAAVTEAFDIDGDARIQLGAVDIGADEVDYCPAYAFPYTVAAGDTTDLTRAINCANANATADTINLTAGTYIYTTGDAANPDSALPRIATDITINGSGATLERASGSPDFRLIRVSNVGTLTLNGVVVTGGSLNNIGGGILNAGTLAIVNSTIAGNSAGFSGGGIYNANNAELTLTNSIVSGNHSSSSGGGVYNHLGATTTVVNSTITGNSAPITGGIYNNTATLTMINGIVWGNSSQIGSGGTATVTYSIVEGGFSGTGNIDADPLFVSEIDHTLAPTTAGDYRLQADSPALNVGSNAALPADTYDLDGDSDTGEPIPYDLDGNIRVVNGMVDMGAYEHQTAAAVVVSETNVDVTEGGATDTYTVHLASPPAADVVITPAGDADCSVSGVLTFTGADWDTPQTVTVTAIDDAVAEGVHGCTVTHTAASSDPAYDGISVASVEGTITDDDRSPFNLINNGGFELHTVNNKVPDFWTVKSAAGDKVLCKPGKPYADLCAFKFVGGVGEHTKLVHNVNFSGETFTPGDTLTFGAYVKGNNSTAKTQLVISVTYTGNPTAQTVKLVVKRNKTYTQHMTTALVLTSGAVEEIKVTFKHKSTAGSVLVDEASVIYAPLGGRDGEALLPPPAAPEGFRGGN